MSFHCHAFRHCRHAIAAAIFAICFRTFCRLPAAFFADFSLSFIFSYFFAIADIFMPLLHFYTTPDIDFAISFIAIFFRFHIAFFHYFAITMPLLIFAAPLLSLDCCHYAISPFH
jgi:hypothetical protein